MEKSDDRPWAILDKILARACEGITKMDKMSADVAAWREPKPAPIHRIEKHTDPMVKSSPQSEGSESSGSSTTDLATISEDGENKPGTRPVPMSTKSATQPTKTRRTVLPQQ